MTVLETEKKRKKIQFPNTIALLFVVILAMALLTYIIPAGEFQRALDEKTGKNLVVAGSFKYIEQSPIGFWKIFGSVFDGIVQASDIIAFIFIVGGAFSIVLQTGAINTALGGLIKKFAGKEHLLIPIVMTAFAIPGATFGMAEETLPFVGLMLAVALALGYDRIVGVALVTVGVYAGYSAGPLNPFSIGIAHKIAGLPIFSGMGFRTVLMVGGLIIAIDHVMRYARKVKKNPDKSLVADEEYTLSQDIPENAKLTSRQKLILVILVATLTILVFAVLKYGWFFAEISALFLLMGVIVGLIAFDGNLNKMTDEFMKGAVSMTSAALLVGVARGVLVIMEQGKIMDTIVYAMSIPLAVLPSVLSAWGMFLVQGLLNFIIPSSSGLAVVSMPIMTPLADLLGITHQVACQAYQSGDGYWNLITPTHPVVMASLGIAGISFNKWLKFMGPLMVKWGILNLIMIAIGTLIKWGPF